MIIEGYRELIDKPYENLPVAILYMYHPPRFTSILPHWHKRMEILLVIEGSLQVTCGEFTGEVKAKEVVLVNPRELHAAASGPEGAKYYSLIFESDLLEGGADACARLYVDPLFSQAVRFLNHVDDDVLFWELLDIIEEYQQRRVAYELALKARLLTLFTRLYRYHVNPRPPALREETGFSQILDYIDEHFTDSITTNSVAGHFCFNKSYFCRKFRQQTGMSFVDYLTNRRLEIASSLLRSTNKSITQIATEVGFNDSNYFSRKYVQRYGLRPTVYRNGE